MSTNSFHNRVAIVTEAGSGIGRAIAIAFAKCGAMVVTADISSDGAQGIAAEIGAAAIPVVVDISDEIDVARATRTALDTFGRIDVLCNNAGVVDKMALPAETPVTTPTPQPMNSPVRKPPSVGTLCPWKSMLIWARTTPTTAAATEVPIDRIRVLKLFAEAVSDIGTADMISAGIAP